VVIARADESGGAGVAALAWIAGNKVVGRHRRCHNPRAQRVASGTIARRTLEYSPHMARTALYIQVRTS